MRHAWMTSLVVVGIGMLAPRVEAQCTCAIAKKDNGWCKDCKVGYFESVKIQSDKLFQALRGHKVDPENVACATCRKALETRGFCDHCRAGFVDGKVYHSWVAYRLAKGEVKHLPAIKCPGCRKAAEKQGWCEKCAVGYVAHRKFGDKKQFEQAVTANKTLALAASSKCERCAIALVTDGACKECGVRYEKGLKTKTKHKL